jgi:hypothetical protein
MLERTGQIRHRGFTMRHIQCYSVCHRAVSISFIMQRSLFANGWRKHSEKCTYLYQVQTPAVCTGYVDDDPLVDYAPEGKSEL